MFSRSVQLTILPLFLLFVVSSIGCNTKELTKEAKELQSKTADEVAFTYDAILAMSKEDLTANIKSLSDRLAKKRSTMPSSAAGATFGSSAQPEIDDKGTDVPATGEDADVSIAYLALPYEVMKQALETK